MGNTFERQPSNMRLGEKIRKYRNLHGLLQKDLGMKMGFSEVTSASRIKKYENNYMAPKLDKREKIAKALDIDLAAISDVEITSSEDIMYVLFELEELYGMKIDKVDGKVLFSFDETNYANEDLISYINIWKDTKDAIIQEGHPNDEQQNHEYALWKSHFKSEIEKYYKSNEDKIYSLYRKDMDSYIKRGRFFNTTSDIVRLICKMIESGLSISAKSILLGTGDATQGITFEVNQLLAPGNNETRELITAFLSEFEHFKQLGAETCLDFQMPDKSLYVTFYVRVSSFYPVVRMTNKYVKYYANKDNLSDFARESFEREFANDLNFFYNTIKEDIDFINKSNHIR